MRQFLVIVLVLAASVAGDAPSHEQMQLSKLQPLVGQWRGVGQPQRGSTKGSWTETAQWAWKFGESGPLLVGHLPDGRYFRELRIAAGLGEGDYRLTAVPAAGGDELRYSGRLDAQGPLVLVADAPREGLPQRVSLRFVAGGDRLLVLMEKQAAAGSFTRLAEVGYTRQGSGFGKVASGQECIVTGGLGTIEVTHAGKTYHVCCTGCRDYFNENPEKVLAEYAAKKKEGSP
jgi:hypothetical protein